MAGQAMGLQETSGTTRTMDGRRPIRASPFLEGERLARISRDLVSGDGRVSSEAARTLRHLAAKGEDIFELFPAISRVLASGDPETVRNLLWALKYAREHGADISSLQPAIDKLRPSDDEKIRLTQDKLAGSMASWFGSRPSR